MIKYITAAVAALTLIFGTGASDSGCEPRQQPKDKRPGITVEAQKDKPQMRAGLKYKVTKARWGAWSSTSWKNKCNWTITHTGKIHGRHLTTKGGKGRGKSNSFVLDKNDMTFASDGNCGTFYKKGK